MLVRHPGRHYAQEVGDEVSGELTPRPCRAADLAAVIGLLAMIEAELMTGEVSEHLAGRILNRALPPPWTWI